MDPDNKQMITCVMVNDDLNDRTKGTPTLMSNYNGLHVNRIQVNCYSSEVNETPTASPNSSASSSSSRLFFVDKKYEQNINKLDQNDQFDQQFAKSNRTPSKLMQNNVQNSLQCVTSYSPPNNLQNTIQNTVQKTVQNAVQNNVHNTVQNTVQNNVQNISNTSNYNVQNIKIVQIANASTAANSLRADPKLILKTNSTSASSHSHHQQLKSIYSEQSLKKQIHHFKERQQNQLRYYSSTSSTASSTSSQKQQFFLNLNKNKQQLIDKNQSESEPLSSFNYSLNSDCSTTDTLISSANRTIRSTNNDNELSSEQSSDGELNRKSSQRTPKLNNVSICKTNITKKSSYATDSSSTSSTSCTNSTDSTSLTRNCNQTKEHSVSEQQSTKNKSASNDNQTSVNHNELYLFSIKRPNELKHYTHEIKFMKTPNWNILTSLIIFTAILVISFLFTIGVYVSVQVFDEQPLTERTFEGQLISLTLEHLWKNNSPTNNNFSNQYIIEDLRAKFAQTFNQSRFSEQLKSVEIVNIKRLSEIRSLDNRLDQQSNQITNNMNRSKYLLINKSSNLSSNNASFLIEFKILFNSNEFDLDLSASTVYMTISSELIKLNESLFNDYNLDQSSLNVRETYPEEDQLERTIQKLLRLVLSNSSILNRRLKRLQLIKLNRLNRTNQLDNLDELDYLEMIANNQTERKKDELRCENRKLSFCKFLPYKTIMYPNLVDHQNLEELEKEFIYFREIIDSECFHLAEQFICLILQPPCPDEVNSNPKVLPCGQLCEQFLYSCSSFIPSQIRSKFYSCQQLNKLQDSILSFKNKTIESMRLRNVANRTGDKFSRNAYSLVELDKVNGGKDELLGRSLRMENEQNTIKDKLVSINKDKNTNESTNEKTANKETTEKTMESRSNLIVKEDNKTNLKQIIQPNRLTDGLSSELLNMKNDDSDDLDNSLRKEKRELTDKGLVDSGDYSHGIKLTSPLDGESMGESADIKSVASLSNNTSNLSVYDSKSVSSSANHKTITNGSSFQNNNQQLGNCFNTDDLEQLSNLSVRTLN